MLKFYTSVILLINQPKEIGDKHFSVFGSRGGQNSPLIHVSLSAVTVNNGCHTISEWILAFFVYVSSEDSCRTVGIMESDKA